MHSLFYKSLVIFFLAIFCSCQVYHSKKANKFFIQENFKSAIKHFEKLNEIEYITENEIKIAESYFKIDNLNFSELYYYRAFQNNIKPSKDFSPYAKVLLYNMKYSEAKLVLKKNLLDFHPTVQSGILLNICNSIQIQDNAKMNFNSIIKENDVNAFSIAEYRDKRAFLSEKNVYNGEETEAWTKNTYLNFFKEEKNINGEWITPKLFTQDKNNRFYDGPASFSQDGKTVYFTRSDYSQNDKVEKQMKIFQATYINDKWSNLEEFPFNSDLYSNGHVSLSNNDSSIYFSSDMPGGYGGFDIYYCKLENGKWSIPENLGSSINSNKNELFPYLDSKDALFYSSDQLNNSGKLDVFITYFNGNRWVKPERINYELTAENNNFGFSFDKNNIENIVTATSKNTKTTIFTLNGRAINKETHMPVEGALIEITTGKTGELIKLYSDEKGYFNFDLEKDINYVVFLKNKNSLTKITSFTTKNQTKSIDFFINYEVELIDLNKSKTIGNIDFDCDKWDITIDLKNELDKLIQLLNYNYSIKLEIASYSDVSGDGNYNKILTQKRSLAVVDYLISQGINKNRLSFEGYGEEKILNRCVNEGIPCSEIEKKQNRRIEYKILSY